MLRGPHRGRAGRRVQPRRDAARQRLQRRHRARCGTRRAAGSSGRFKGHAQSVNSVAYSRDGRRLVSAGADGTVRVWSVDGRPARWSSGATRDRCRTRRSTRPGIAWSARARTGRCASGPAAGARRSSCSSGTRDRRPRRSSAATAARCVSAGARHRPRLTVRGVRLARLGPATGARPRGQRSSARSNGSGCCRAAADRAFRFSSSVCCASGPSASWRGRRTRLGGASSAAGSERERGLHVRRVPRTRRKLASSSLQSRRPTGVGHRRHGHQVSFLSYARCGTRSSISRSDEARLGDERTRCSSSSR